MTNNQGSRVELFAGFLSLPGSPEYICIDKRRAHIDKQFERYDLDLSDITHLLENDFEVKPHLGSPGGLLEVHGQSVEEQDMVICGYQKGPALIVLNVWIK